jgi:RNA polymerase sigma-70 factor (ECF subfamily)
MQAESADRTKYEWLALRCQSGDPGAFEDLIAVMERPLLYYAMSLTGSQDIALDVLQEVCIKTLRGIRKLKDAAALRPWLYSITHGVAVDRIRREYARDRAQRAELENFQEVEEPSFAEEDAVSVHQALSQLGVKHREVCWSCIFSMTYRLRRSQRLLVALREL